MAKQSAIPFKEVKPVVIGAAGAYDVARVQRLDVPVNLPTTDIDELGNYLHAGQVTDLPEVSGTIQAMDVSAKLYAALIGTAYASFTSSDISNLSNIDFVAEIKSDTISDIAKSLHVRKAKISGFTYTYSIDGEATEEYTFQATEKRWLKYDVVVEDLGTTGTSLSLANTPITLKNTHKLLSFIVDGTYWTEVADGAVLTSNQYSVSGTTVTLFSSPATASIAVYHFNATNDWTYISDSTIPAAIRGKNVTVALKAANVNRVQSVTIRGTFPTTPVKEMGTTSIIAYVDGVPSVEGDISVLDTDTELIALFATGEVTPADVEFNICEFTSSGISLEVVLYDPALDCNLPIASGTVQKTIYIAGITITSEGHSTNVGGQATQTFGFKSTLGDCAVYKGAK